MLASKFINACCKRQLSASALTCATLLYSPRNGEEHKNPSQKTHKYIPSLHVQASMEAFETTHVDEFHLRDSFYSNALKISAKRIFLPEGKQLHSHILKLGYECRQSLQNQLLNMYVKCMAFDDAHRLFDEMPKSNVVSWNIMISGFVGSGHNLRSSDNLSLFWFRKMLVDMVEPNYITFIGLLGACIELNDVEIGTQLHSFVIKSKFELNLFVGSALVDLYGKCGLLEDARRLFNRIQSRDLVLWNVMVSSYALNGLGEEAFGVFELMRSEGVKGDGFTYSSLLNSSGTLGSCELGKQIHGVIIRLSFDLDVFVASALVDMYMKCCNLIDARKAFDGMIIQNVVSWTTMIVGYGRHGDGKEAMKLLRKMLQGCFDPDELTLASVLSSCANLAAITEIVQVHAHAAKNGLEAFLSMGNALINAYSKCGNIASAFLLFSLIMDPSLVTWTSMISAYAFHGLSKQAIEVFEKMLSKGVRPDRIAYVGVLSACSHGGLVDEGFHYFASMTRDHQIMPDLEHYACLVDLLGRSGHLHEAYDILINMPFEPSVNVLGAFIGACKTHGNIGLAKWAAEKLFKLEPDEPVNYTLMSNIYASVGNWIDVARLRKMMRDHCDYKVPGCSWMEIGGKVHTFVSSDKSHSQATEMYVMLGLLAKLMKEEGCHF